jgi:hypothetical protein
MKLDYMSCITAKATYVLNEVWSQPGISAVLPGLTVFTKHSTKLSSNELNILTKSFITNTSTSTSS